MFPRISTVTLTLCFLISQVHGNSDSGSEVGRVNKYGLLSIIEDKLEEKISDYVGQFTRWLEKFNDKHLGRSQLGRFLHYDEIKPKVDWDTARTNARRHTKHMMPLIFQLGATSTWMVLTSILTAKSVAIGLVLLVFKIAVSSAKLASFFTLLKNKHHDHHSEWTVSAHPHYEHHGHDRSFKDESHIDHHPSHHSHHQDWSSYTPEWTPEHDYHTISKSHDKPEYNGPYLPAEDRSKDDKKKF